MKLDMLWGNPSFLRGYWDEFSSSIDIRTPFPTHEMDYQSSGKDELKLVIKELHYYNENIDLNNKYIVIGNGATQILKGLFKIHENIHTEIPYYSRFPILCDIVKADFNKFSERSNKPPTQVHTIPGNPDTSEIFYRSPYEIFDLSYNWPIYTDKIYKDPTIKTAVFSFSKTTGFASTRIGWAILDDKNTADKLEEFIEYDTSGVSVEAQDKAIEILDHINNYELSNIFDYGRNELKNRWESIKSLHIPFQIMNKGRGMFLLAKGEIPKELNALKGSAMGLSDEYFRLNIGCSQEIFENFINLYKK